MDFSPNSTTYSLVSLTESPVHPVSRSLLETLQTLYFEASHVSSTIQMRKLRQRKNKVTQLMWLNVRHS